jgi:2-phospho-L-lactate guanylyltransferase
LKISAIIPVKTFSKAKTRLDFPDAKKEEFCKLMFKEVLQTLSVSSLIDKILVVTKDEDALSISKKFNTIQIIDNEESGVNHAVSLADSYAIQNGFDASVVFPQDIPFMKTQDIDFLLKFQNPPKFSLIVPSRKFDGTNALVRMPVDLMETHYDEDSYKIHLSTGRKKTPNTSLVFIRRIMLDIDDESDLNFALIQKEKPALCEQILNLIR